MSIFSDAPFDVEPAGDDVDEILALVEAEASPKVTALWPEPMTLDALQELYRAKLLPEDTFRKLYELTPPMPIVADRDDHRTDALRYCHGLQVYRPHNFMGVLGA